MNDVGQQFIELALREKALLFGEFKTKAGRLSPYFFDLGRISDGASLGRVAEFYVSTITASGITFDMLFGPAYKGIALATAVSIKFAQAGRAVPFCFNRKEAKDHGEGGELIGAPPAGRVLIVDDVISAGTSLRESAMLIRRTGAEVCGLVVALDRMERGLGERSAAQEMAADFPVASIVNLDDLIAYLQARDSHRGQLEAILRYRERYGVKA
jgi:orotate phosphoribosyltransferase